MQNPTAQRQPAPQRVGALLRQVRPAARRLAGWCCLAVGLALLFLPGPGSLLILIGVALLGRRHPALRRVRVALWRQSRHWSRSRDARRWLGIYGLELARRLRGAPPTKQG